MSKTFAFPVKNPRASWVKNLFAPERKTVHAVKDISFSVRAGERIAFIGPNGAGKSTTIKMLTGILHPSSGTMSVLGFDPIQERKQLAYKIGTVFGQRSQLFPNLPLSDSLEFFGVMYDVPNDAITRRVSELVELFELSQFIDQPVRKLSLGQRMRAEVAASLMHRPQLILLDEPTIGLDVVAKKALRDLLLRINTQEKATIFLTSHDVGDIETLCERTIVINHGTLVEDLPTKELARLFAFEKKISLIPHDRFEVFPNLPAGMRYDRTAADKITVTVDAHVVDVQPALQALLGLFDVEDIDVRSIGLEEVIRHMYERDAHRV